MRSQENALTIGIGVLCSSAAPGAPSPDTLVLVADTMGSTDYDSTHQLHKLVFDQENKIYAAVAGRLDVASELPSLVRAELQQGQRTHGNIWRALTKAVHKHWSEHFQRDVVLTNFAIGDQVLEQQHGPMMEAWRKYDPGYQVIFGTFDDHGMAMLYYIGPSEAPGRVSFVQFPGHCTIGTGCYNASMWLNYRQQRLGMTLRESALHAFEASKMAASAPTVNERPDLIIATSEQAFAFSEERPAGVDCPLNLPELERLARKFGPKSTRKLGQSNRPMISDSSQT
jgi:hypothetical protein